MTVVLPARRGLDTYRMIVAAGGFRDVVPLLAAALVVTVFFHDGTIDHLGPLVFSPQLPVMVMVPIILAVACSGAHATARAPVIVRNARVRLARGLSVGTALALSGIVLTVGAALGTTTTGTVAASARDLLLLVGCACATGALVGSSYAWVPVVVLLGSAVLSPADDSDWSLYGLLLRGTASPGQLAVAALVCCVGVAVAIWDPRSPGYLVARR